MLQSCVNKNIDPKLNCILIGIMVTNYRPKYLFNLLEGTVNLPLIENVSWASKLESTYIWKNVGSGNCL